MHSYRSSSMGRVVREWGRRWLGIIAGLLVAFTGLAAPALAYDNPDLLPDHPTPVIDLAKILTDPQRESLESNLSNFEAESGWKLRVLTQYDRTPGQAVKSFWNLDERSLLLVADERGGNLLNFKKPPPPKRTYGQAPFNIPSIITDTRFLVFCLLPESGE